MEKEVAQQIERAFKAVANTVLGLNIAVSYYSDWKIDVELNNIHRLIEKHTQELQQLYNKINHTYLTSDDYKYMLYKTVIKARDEIRESKKKLFSEFLTKSCFMKNSNNQEKMLYLEVIDKIDINHLEILQFINNNLATNDGWTIDGDLKSIYKDYTEDQLNFYIQYFTSIGLVLPHNKFEIINEHLIMEIRYRLTELCLNLLDYLSNE